jgi:hypothetical protein
MSIAEVCFTDTFETEDSGYKYGQALLLIIEADMETFSL